MVNLIENVSFEYDLEKLKEYCNYLNKQLDNEKEYSIVAMNNEEIHALNLEFRGVDRSTDVLSFEEHLDDYLGDILISIEKTHTQAQEYGHSYERELLFLITHGFLHLNGYDHQTEAEETEMFTLQRKLLTNYGIER